MYRNVWGSQGAIGVVFGVGVGRCFKSLDIDFTLYALKRFPFLLSINVDHSSHMLQIKLSIRSLSQLVIKDAFQCGIIVQT